MDRFSKFAALVSFQWSFAQYNFWRVDFLGMTFSCCDYSCQFSQHIVSQKVTGSALSKAKCPLHFSEVVLSVRISMAGEITMKSLALRSDRDFATPRCRELCRQCGESAVIREERPSTRSELLATTVPRLFPTFS